MCVQSKKQNKKHVKTKSKAQRGITNISMLIIMEQAVLYELPKLELLILQTLLIMYKFVLLAFFANIQNITFHVICTPENWGKQQK